MTNPTHCAVCQSPLIRTTALRTADEPEETFGEEGFYTQWDTDTVVVQIHCPQCQLLYRVSDPHDT